MNMDEFAVDRTIEPTELDVEAAQQADLFFKWAQRAVKARARVDRQKLRLDTLDARLSLECRSHPENFGLERTTEGAIVAAVKTHEDYAKAYDAYLRAKESSALMDKAVEAMEQKKRMLEVLITLHGQQYFAGPSVPRDLSAAWQEHQQRATDLTTQRQVESARQRGQDADE